MTRATVAGIMDMEYRYTAGQNNGRIAQSKDWISGEEVTYTYDSLQRLASATTTGTQWGEAYSYDGFGNLTGKTPTKGSAPALSVVYNPATNQPYNGNYDANGNAPVGTWDIENRLVGQTLDGQAIAWGYDPSGKRVTRLQTVNGLPTWSFYLYGMNGERLGQMGCTATWGSACTSAAGQGAETYFGGKLIASTDASGHLLGATDRLGTVRGVQTNGTWAEPTYFPYGEPRTAGGIDGKEQFGTYVRDSTGSAQDYAGQRYYSNIAGRFFSPDPSGVRAADPKNPGSWNRYAYVNGDPVNFRDRRGLYSEGVSVPEDAPEDQCDLDPNDIGSPLSCYPQGTESGGGGDCDSMFGFMEVSFCSGGGGPGDPGEPPDPPETCTLSLEYRNLDTPGGRLGAHAYLYFTSSTGLRRIIEGYTDDSDLLKAHDVSPAGALAADNPAADKIAGSISSDTAPWLCGSLGNLDYAVGKINDAKIDYSLLAARGKNEFF